jgi:hypothetical protein
MYDWASLRYRGNELDSCSVDIVGCLMHNNNEIYVTGFDKIDISRLDHKCACSNFPKDTTYVVLFTEYVSIN